MLTDSNPIKVEHEKGLDVDVGCKISLREGFIKKKKNYGIFPIVGRPPPPL